MHGSGGGAKMAKGNRNMDSDAATDTYIDNWTDGYLCWQTDTQVDKQVLQERQIGNSVRGHKITINIIRDEDMDGFGKKRNMESKRKETLLYKNQLLKIRKVLISLQAKLQPKNLQPGGTFVHC